MSTTTTETIARKIAAEVTLLESSQVDECCGADVAAGSVAALPGDIERGDIVSIVELIMGIVTSLMENCDRKESALLKAMKSPRRWHKVRFRNHCRRQCEEDPNHFCRSKGSKVADSLLDYSARANEDELKAVLAESRDDDNWLI